MRRRTNTTPIPSELERRADPSRLLAPGRRAHILARVRQAQLDDALARGADPATSPVLAARAQALAAADGRHALASGIEARLRPGSQRHTAISPPPATLGSNERALAEIAALLREDRPLYARGLAMMARLLSDGTGPLYARSAAGPLAVALTDARAALAA